MSPETKVWFIVATLRKPEALSELTAKYPQRLLVIKLDVTEPAEVTAAFTASREKFGCIDIVVNNAGFCVLGEVEGTSDHNARSVFEVNFWGASHVSREAVRFFREENKPRGGRLLQMSSSAGIHAPPSLVYYGASKFALEALSEGIAQELDPSWNIKVTILEPGPFRTKCPAANRKEEPVHPAYHNPSLLTMQVRSLFVNTDIIFDGDPEKLAEVVYRVAYLEDPPLRLPLHKHSLATFRERGKQLLETADKWESWSEDLLIKN